jgi:hypothetical protein
MLEFILFILFIIIFSYKVIMTYKIQRLRHKLFKLNNDNLGYLIMTNILYNDWWKRYQVDKSSREYISFELKRKKFVVQFFILLVLEFIILIVIY